MSLRSLFMIPVLALAVMAPAGCIAPHHTHHDDDMYAHDPYSGEMHDGDEYDRHSGRSHH